VGRGGSVAGCIDEPSNVLRKGIKDLSGRAIVVADAGAGLSLEVRPICKHFGEGGGDSYNLGMAWCGSHTHLA